MNLPEVLLIGGMGFVGRQLQGPLLSAGYKVHVIDRKSARKGQNDNIEYYECLLFDEYILNDIMTRCKIVFYLASDSVPTTTSRSPSREGELNLIPFLKFLDAFQDCRQTHLVYLSSGGTIYGNPVEVPVVESSPIAPISYHGAGKAAIEAFLHASVNQGDNRITILRPSNLYGPFQNYVPGFGIIRSMMEKLRLDLPIEIWGDGENIRDYLYIDDLISACMACAQMDRTEQHFRIFNVSSGQSISINQLCSFIEEATEKKLKKAYLPGREIDVRSVILDASKIKKEMGWEPVVGIEEGLKRTWQWLNHPYEQRKEAKLL